MIMVCFVPLLRHLHNTKQLEKKIDQQQPNSPRRKEINFVIGNKIKKNYKKTWQCLPIYYKDLWSERIQDWNFLMQIGSCKTSD